ncbi:MAG: histidinol-phosphate transaminase [Kiritimatiellae bacterium]|nr:histidinol-phosphate transaminase [Kiritimatiellia bacterium]
MTALTHNAKPWISSLHTYQPGRPIEDVARELGIEDVASIIKLASNENPLGPSPRALEAIRHHAASIHRYPDGGNHDLREALAAKHGIRSDELFLGHGSNEIIALLGHVYLDETTSIVMSQYAFIVYPLVAALYRAQVITVPASDYGHDLEAMLDAIEPSTRLVFVTNPNNPTGTAVSAEALASFLDRLPDSVIAVLDEAYIDYLPPENRLAVERLIRDKRSVFVLRTFSKGYGLAGLRIGYAMAPAEGIDLLNRVRQPFNVNSLAQAAALAAISDEAHLTRTREVNRQERDRIASACEALGFACVPSAANFILVETGQGRLWFEELQKRKVIVRPVSGYGLPDHIRITIGTPEENDRLLAAMRAVHDQVQVAR